MKLADSIAIAGESAFPDGTPKSVSLGALSLIEDAVHVDISNVFYFLMSGTDRQFDDWAEDFPCIMPPFDRMWLEHSLPRSIPLAGVDQIVHLDRSGILLTSSRQDDGGAIVWMMFFDRFRQSGEVMFRGMSSLNVNREGKFCPGSLQYYSHEGETIAGAPLAVLLSISFMHCKNVESAEDASPAKVVKAFTRRHKRPPYRFHTLIIDPMKQVLRTEGGIEQHGLKKALHICRGHFAHYTEDRPLFGKYSGTFWKPAHVRGSADVGTVYKDYKVKSPKG